MSVLLAHEAFHSDGRASDLEELVAVAVQSLVHMQQLLADPEIAQERTELAQSANAWIVIRLNTHRPGSSDLRLVLVDDGPTVLPGGLGQPHFAAFFDPTAAPTPGNRYLREVAEAVAEIVDKAISGRLDPVQKSVEGMSEFFTYLQEQSKASDAEGGGKDLSTRLFEEPDQVIQEEFAKHATPLVQAQAATMSEFILNEQKERIDSRWGEGAWEAVYQDEMSATMERVSKTNPMAIMNREAITNAVDTLTGRNTDALLEHKAKWKETQDKDQETNVQNLTEAVIKQGNLTGGLRRNTSRKPTLGAEHDESLDAFFRATGKKPDRDRLATMMTLGSELGTSYEDWKAAKEKE